MLGGNSYVAGQRLGLSHQHWLLAKLRFETIHIKHIFKQAVGLGVLHRPSAIAL